MKEIIEPSEFIEKMGKKIKKEWLIAFISAIVIGIITHLFIMVNILPNHDGLSNIYSTQNVTHLGRWFLQYACGITSYYNLPLVIGSVSILLLALTSCILIELFDVKNKLNIILISGILVTFPTIASTFSYIYTADGYMLALLLASISVLLAYKYKYGFLIGAVFVCLSLGIYQAYISVTILLCIFKVLFSIINEDKIDNIKWQILKCVAMGIIGFVLYYIMLKIMLSLQGKYLSSYQGIEELNSFSLGNIASGIIVAFKNFFKFIVGTSFYRSNLLIEICNIIVMVCLFVLFMKEYIIKKRYKNVFNNVLVLLLIFAVPIACNIVYVISKSVDYHLLMRYAYCLFYVGVIVLIEKTSKVNLTKWVITVAIMCIIFNFIIVSNIGYINLYYKFEKSYSLAERVSKTILECDEYNKDTKVAIIGVIDKEYYPTTNDTSKVTSALTGTEGNSIFSRQRHYAAFFENYFNLFLNFATDNEIEDIKQTEEFKQMENYPSKDSIKKINNILVLKLSE